MDDVHLDQGISMSVDQNFSPDPFHHWECNDTIGQEVVIQAGQISSPTCKEFQCGLDIQAQSVTAFNAAQNLLFLLGEKLLMCCMMLNYRRRGVYGGKSGNVVERGIVVQRRRIGLCQKGLVD